MTVRVAIPGPLHNALVHAELSIGWTFAGQQFDKDETKPVDVTFFSYVFGFFCFYDAQKIRIKLARVSQYLQLKGKAMKPGHQE